MPATPGIARTAPCMARPSTSSPSAESASSTRLSRRATERGRAGIGQSPASRWSRRRSRSTTRSRPSLAAPRSRARGAARVDRYEDQHELPPCGRDRRRESASSDRLVPLALAGASCSTRLLGEPHDLDVSRARPRSRTPRCRSGLRRDRRSPSYAQPRLVERAARRRCPCANELERVARYPDAARDRRATRAQPRVYERVSLDLHVSDVPQPAASRRRASSRPVSGLTSARSFSRARRRRYAFARDVGRALDEQPLRGRATTSHVASERMPCVTAAP